MQGVYLFSPRSIALSMPFGEMSPTQISSAWRNTYSLHQVATFLLSREPLGWGESRSARPSRQAAASSGESALSGGMPCGMTWMTRLPLARARSRASRSCALVKVEIRMGGLGVAKATRSDEEAARSEEEAPRSDGEASRLDGEATRTDGEALSSSRRALARLSRLSSIAR